MPVRPSPMCWIWCSPGKGSVGRISSSLISPGLILSAWRGVSREKCGIHPLFLCAGVPDIAISPGRFPAGQRPFRKTDLIFLMARKRAGTWDECCTFPATLLSRRAKSGRGMSTDGENNSSGRFAYLRYRPHENVAGCHVSSPPGRDLHGWMCNRSGHLNLTAEIWLPCEQCPFCEPLPAVLHFSYCTV